MVAGTGSSSGVAGSIGGDAEADRFAVEYFVGSIVCIGNSYAPRCELNVARLRASTYAVWQ